jgi:hypothetical protein
MKVFRALVLAGCSTLCAVGPAAAQPDLGPHSSVGLSANVSTLGLGVDAAFPVLERANVRVGFNLFNLNHDFDNDGITLAASLQLSSFSAHFDWFAFGGGFHISPGVMVYNGNKVTAVATVPAGQKFSLGDENLFSNAANPVNGSARISWESKVAPSLLMGWGNIIPHGDRRWSIPFELGVVYSKAPTSTLAFGGSACAQNGTNCRNIATDPTLQADVAKEQTNMNSDLSVLKLIPVVSLGFSYKF